MRLPDSLIGRRNRLAGFCRLGGRLEIQHPAHGSLAHLFSMSFCCRNSRPPSVRPCRPKRAHLSHRMYLQLLLKFGSRPDCKLDGHRIHTAKKGFWE